MRTLTIAIVLTVVVAVAHNGVCLPCNTNSGSFNATTNATGDFNAFNWSWMGYENQAINANFTPAGSSNIWLRLAYPRRGTVFLDVTNGVIANGTNYTVTILRSNLPPNGIYFAEFLGFENSYTSIPTRTMATGKINLQRSLFENLTQATWTNPSAGTVIGPPIHSLSDLSGWPFTQPSDVSNIVNGIGASGISAATATGIVQALAYPLTSNLSNYTTIATAAELTNGLAGTGYVDAAVGGYLPTSTVFVAAESDPAWAAASNGVVYTNDARLTDARTPTAHDQPLSTITNAGSAAYSNASAFATAAQGALAASALQLVDLTDGTVNGVAIGSSASANTDGVALGTGPSANSHGVAIGSGASVNVGGVAIGSNATANANGISIGNSANGDSGLAIGIGAASVAQAIAVGDSANSASERSIAIGYGANANNGGVSLGLNSTASYTNTASILGSAISNGFFHFRGFPYLDGDGNVYGSGSNLTGITAAQVGAVATNDAVYLASVTGLVVNGTTGTVAGGVASVTLGGVFAPASLLPLVSATTCTLTRAMIATNAAWSIVPTGTVYFAAAADLTDTNIAAVFAIDLFYNDQTFGFVGDSITNTKTLTSNAWNSIIFDKGSGATQFTGR